MNFLKSLPNLERLVLSNVKIEDISALETLGNINSFDFIKEMNHLEWLQLSYNEYNCSLMSLMLATNLTKLDMFGNTSDDFKQLPLIPSVRELYFGGNIIPTREDAERYFKWDNLEELWLGGDKYDVATGTWITPKNE